MGRAVLPAGEATDQISVCIMARVAKICVVFLPLFWVRKSEPVIVVCLHFGRSRWGPSQSSEKGHALGAHP